MEERDCHLETRWMLRALEMNVQRRMLFSSISEKGILNMDGHSARFNRFSVLKSETMAETSLEEYVLMIQNCRRDGYPVNPLLFYNFLCASGIESSTSLGNQIVCMLADCRALSSAQQLFDRLELRCELTWNTLITSYVMHKQSHNAFYLYQKMQEGDSLYPNSYTLVSLLNFCGNAKDIERGLRLHVDLARKGLLERHHHIKSALLEMYLMCGLIARAQESFDKFTAHNVVLWTLLIAGYSNLGLGKEAIDCYKKMQCVGLLPDSVAFICTLKACGATGELEEGQQVHAELERVGLVKKDVVVGNILIDMYAKCGLLNRAREVLDHLPVRNVVSWTALITGCVDHGYGMMALLYFKEMQIEGVPPNAVTFVSCLKACGLMADLEKGSELHLQLKSDGFLEQGPSVGCALVDMYAKSGLLVKAQDAFDKLTLRNVVSWNALITGYAESGFLATVQSCLEKMRREGFEPDAVTFIAILKACGSARDLDTGREMHLEIEQSGLLMQDPLVGSSLVDMYAQCGLLSKAQEVFENLPDRDVITWNSLLAGFISNDFSEEALICYDIMHDEGIHPDMVTYVCGLKACGSLKALKKGQEIHSDIVRKGGNLRRDAMIGNCLVDMYGMCGLAAKSQEVFDRLATQDVVSWNALIAGYVQNAQGETALDCFEQMQLKGTVPTSVSFLYVLKACGSLGALEKAQAIHVEIERKGLLKSDLHIGSALVDFYSKHGFMHIAHQVFTSLPVRNVVLWNALITGYVQLGECEHVTELFERMLLEGTKASYVTFVILLNACSQTGLVKKGETYFQTMTRDFGVSSTPEHQICMVDLFSRAGLIEEALSMLKRMPLYGELSVWHSVLGACEKLGMINIGIEIFRCAQFFDSKDPSIYAMMSNIYATSISDEKRSVEAKLFDKDSLVSQKSFSMIDNKNICVFKCP